MIVENYGYTSAENVLKLNLFCIYKTYKNTFILINLDNNPYEYNFIRNTIELYTVKKDKLPFKIAEGKKITHGVIVFDSTKDDKKDLDISEWNGSKQIITYKPYKI